MLYLLAAAGPGLALPPEPSAVAAGPLESVVTIRVDGSIVVDERGQVTAFHIDTPVLPAISAPLERIVPQWRFKPVLVDGKPHSARGQVRLILAAQKVGESYQARIDNVVFRDDFNANSPRAGQHTVLITPKSMPPPAYPPGVLRAGVSGRVLLAVKVAPDGRADKVAAVQTLLFDVKGRDPVLREAIRQFEHAAVKATSRWRFNVAARDTPPSGHDMIVMVPVAYIVGDATVDTAGTWHTVVRAPKRQPEWLEDAPGLQRVGVADVSGAELMPASSVLQLATNVAGAPVM